MPELYTEKLSTILIFNFSLFLILKKNRHIKQKRKADTYWFYDQHIRFSFG
ncbi:hypothetical protein N5D_21360 [Enterococcus faecalis]|nr:hypothetical protein N5D_21360 [Enterococcus faecalis]